MNAGFILQDPRAFPVEHRAGAGKRRLCGLKQAGRRLRAWCFALALLGALATGGASVAQVVPEADLRAAFIFNFLLLVEWPAATQAKDEPALILCSWGQGPTSPALSQLAGRQVGAKTLAVERVQEFAGLARCHAVVISEAREAKAVLTALAGRPVLTIGEFEGSVTLGTTIGLTRMETRLTFEVNLDAARASGLRVSAKLLRLARHVVGG